MRNKLIQTLTFYLLLVFVSPFAIANNDLPARIQIGINLFPAVIAANKQFRILEQDTGISILLVYQNNQALARRSARQLRQLATIRGRTITVQIISLDQLLEIDSPDNSALFMVEPVNKELPALINYSKQQNLILFSPFQGDVEKGVLSGFKVTNKVLPAINIKTMQASRIDLKAFFLRIAVKYDQ